MILSMLQDDLLAVFLDAYDVDAFVELRKVQFTVADVGGVNLVAKEREDFHLGAVINTRDFQ